MDDSEGSDIASYWSNLSGTELNFLDIEAPYVHELEAGFNKKFMK